MHQKVIKQPAADSPILWIFFLIFPEISRKKVCANTLKWQICACAERVLRAYCLFRGYVMTVPLGEAKFTAIGVKHLTEALPAPARRCVNEALRFCRFLLQTHRNTIQCLEPLCFSKILMHTSGMNYSRKMHEEPFTLISERTGCFLED